MIEQQTSLSLCRQLQQSASLSDDKLEYAAAGTASLPSEAAFSSSAEAAQPGPDQAAEALSAGGASPPPPSPFLQHCALTDSSVVVEENRPREYGEPQLQCMYLDSHMDDTGFWASSMHAVQKQLKIN